MGRKRSRGRSRGPRSHTRRRPQTMEGTIRVLRPGVAEVACAEGTFPVARGGIREAMDADRVRVSLVSRSGTQMAVVQGVIERATSSFIGTYHDLDPLGVVVALDRRMQHDFFVTPGDTSVERLGVSEGDVVVARVLEYPTRKSAGVVTIDARRGAADELDLAVESIVASSGLATEFGEAALAEADALLDDVAETIGRETGRRDLRGTVTLTVDPTDARDFDDAVSARRTDDGFELEVHIADVAHYVAPGGAIDNEARRRTCSTYLVDRVIPMLPERLSCDLCSLRPGVDRLTMSVALTLDERGELTGAEAFPAAIRSRARLDYDTVDALLSGEVDDLALPVACDAAADPEADPDDAAEAEKSLAFAVADTLRVLDEVARLRAKVRAGRGAIDFDTREAKVVLDESGAPTGVRVREKTRATSLIEEAMLLANEAVAGMLAVAEAPAAFRVHERPAPDDLAATLPILGELGVCRGRRRDAIVAGDPHAIRAALADARGTAGEFLVNSVLLRAQKRAVYLPRNDGHYALGAKAYCHFTSPIRRYPDLIVHRSLAALVAGRARCKAQQELARDLPQLCRTCSEQERVADRAARDSQKVKMAELYRERIGESFSGVVVGCERFGLFVMLDDTCAEGLVPTRALGDEWFYFDESRLMLIGEESGRSWQPGKRVAVTVTGANPARGQIDFALADGRA